MRSEHRHMAALAGTIACLALNLPGTGTAATPWSCGAALTGGWTPPWLPQPAPDRHDMACHLMAGCRRDERERDA